MKNTIRWSIQFKKCLAFATFAFVTASAYSNPVLNNISSGNVTIQQTPTITTINQTSQSAIINWNSFNIGSQERTHFQQPAGGIALNRISASDGPSSIYGTLTATGQIILINPAGIYFGPSAFVNVGGLIATTRGITDKNFLQGNYQFAVIPGYSGSIINAGTIIATQHGLIALVGDNVSNSGLIQANLGHVILASGGAFTMSFAGNDLINFNVDSNSLNGSVTNTGTLRANGGTILVTAQTASNVLDDVINMQGVVEAKSVGTQNGDIIISGNPDAGIVDVAANINASGLLTNQTGGNVSITGFDILLGSSTLINASGNVGGGNIYVGGNAHGAGPLPNANATVMEPNATLLANALTNGNGGNIVLWSEEFTNANGTINAEGGAQGGNGGFVETSSHNYLDANGVTVNTSAAHGNLGTWLLDPSDLTISTAADSNNTGSSPFEPASSASNSILNITTLTNALASNAVMIETTNNGGPGSGNIYIDTPISWSNANNLTLSAYASIIDQNAASTGAIIANTGGASVVLQADNTGTGVGTVSFNTGNFVSLSGGSGTVSIYYNPATFGTNTAVYSGGTTATQYMLINSLGAATDSGSTTNTASLATVSNTHAYWNQNFALATNINAAATSGWNGGTGFMPIGSSSAAYTGKFDGQGYQISNLYENQSTSEVGFFGRTNGASIKNIGLVNADIIASGGSFEDAILDGYDNHSTISNAYSSGSVSGGSLVGGLVGTLTGNSTLTDSYSTATVSGTTSGIGGLVGLVDPNSSLTDSYSAGTVMGGVGAIGVGGLVGEVNANGSVANSYSIGSVTAGAGSLDVGGFAGLNSTGSIQTSYSSSPVNGGSGSTNVGGFIGSNNSGTLTDNFFDTSTSGISSTQGCGNSANCAGVTGDSTATLLQQSTYPVDWTFGTTPNSANWYMINGETRPILQMEYTTNIVNAHELELVDLNLSGSYSIINNINASGTSNAADVWGGNGFVPIGQNTTAYTGLFNGNDNVISNLYINQQPSHSFIGLFAQVNGDIQNLGLSNVNIIATGGFEVGALAGELETSGFITDSFATGNITGGYLQVGGLVGIQEGSISNSFASVNISTTDSGGEIGGLVGDQSFSSLSNSYATGNVNAPNATGGVGGLIGSSGGIVNYNFSTGQVIGASGVGGLIGSGTPLVTSSYWNVTTSGIGTSGSGTGSAGGTGESTANMMTQSTFSGWDFTGTWGILANQSYPYHLWEFPTTPQSVTGFITPNPSSIPLATTVSIANNGTLLAPPVVSGVGVDGFYYTLSPNNTFASGNDVLVMLSNGTSGNSVILAPSANASIAGTSPGEGLDIIQSTLTLNLTNGSISPTALLTANNNNTLSNALYSVSGENITLNNNTSFTLATDNGTPTYTLLGNITTSGSGSIILPTNVNLSLGASSTLSTGTGGTGTITLDAPLTDAVAGTDALTLASDNIITLDNTIGASALPLLSLTTEGNTSATTGTTAIDTTAITTTGLQTYANAVTLGASTLLKSTGSDISMASVNLQTFNLDFNNAGASSQISGLISGSGNLTKDGVGTLTIADNANTFTGSTTIDSGILSVTALTNAGSASSLGEPTGASATITLGSSSAATLIDTNSSASDTSNRAIAIGGTGGGTITATAGTLTLSGGVNTNGDTVNFNTNGGNIVESNNLTGSSGNLIVSGNTSNTFTLSSSSSSITGSVTVDSNGIFIDDDSNILEDPSAISVNSGSVLNLGFSGATLNTGPIITLNGTGSGAGALQFSGNTDSLANQITLGSNADIGGTGTGEILAGLVTDGANTFSLTKVGTGTITLGDANIYHGGTTVSAGILAAANSQALGLGASDAVLVSAGGTLQIDSGYNVGNAITLNGTGSAGQGALVGTGGNNATASGAITLNANTTIGTLSNVDELILSSSTVTGNAHTLTLAGTGTGAVSLGDTFSNVNALTSNTNTTINANLTTTNGQTYNNPVTLGSTATLTGNGIDFASTITGGGNGLVLADAGTSTLGGVVSGLNTLQTNAVAINTTGITTSGAQTYGAITLGNNVTLTGVDIDLTSTVTGGGKSLALSDTGTSTLAGVVSGVSTLTTDAINMNSTSVTTSGSESYGAMKVGTNATLNAVGITLASVDDSVSGTHSFTANAGAGTLDLSGAIGSNHALLNFTASTTGAANNITIGNNITTTNNINLTAGGSIAESGNAVMSNSGVLTTSAVGNTTLNNANTISGFNATDTAGNIALTNTGALNITGIAQTGGSVTINNSGAISQSGAIAVSGTSSFNAGTNAINLNDNSNHFQGTVALQNSGNNNVTVNNTGTLTIAASTFGSGTNTITNTGALFTAGNLTSSGGAINLFTNAVGATASVITVSNDNITTNGGAINLTADQNNPINTTALVLNNTILATSPGTGGALILGGGVTQSGVTLNLGSGDITLQGSGTNLVISGINSFPSALTLSVPGTIDLSGTLSTTAGALTILTPVTLTGNTVISSPASVTLGSITGSADTLDISSTTGTRLNGAIDVKSLALSGSTLDTIATNSITTTGTQTYSDPLALMSDVTMNAGASAITLGSAVNGEHSLTLTSSGAKSIDNTVGGSTPLMSLTLNGGGTIALNTSSVNTVDDQVYSDPLTLNASTPTFTSSSGNVTFGNTLSGAQDVTVSSAGTTTFDNNVGGTPLNSLTVTASAVDIGNGTSMSIDTNGNQIYKAPVVLGGNVVMDAMSTGANTISITGGVSGSNTLGLTSNGSNSNFVVNGPVTASGLSVTGGSGTSNNTLTAGSSSTETWNINGTDLGTINGSSFSYSNIQNLNGGTNGNTFIFANGAMETGAVNGGSLSAINTLNYAAWSTPVSATLSSNIFNGNIINNNGVSIASYININNLAGNVGTANTLNLPNKLNKVTITGAQQGYINDPLTFTGFSIFKATPGTGNIVFFDSSPIFNGSSNTVIVDGSPMTFENFILNGAPSGDLSVLNPNISAIIQQPNSYTTNTSSPFNATINQNIDDLVSQFSYLYNVYLSNLKIDTNCGS